MQSREGTYLEQNGEYVVMLIIMSLAVKWKLQVPFPHKTALYPGVPPLSTYILIYCNILCYKNVLV